MNIADDVYDTDNEGGGVADGGGAIEGGDDGFAGALKAPLENPADRFRGYGVVCGCKSARDSAFEMNAHILYNQSASDSPLDKNKSSL